MAPGITTSVDPEALRAAGMRLDTVADLLQGVLRTYLDVLHFHADPAVRSALEDLVAEVRRWQCAARDTAAVLHTGAQWYSDADASAAEALR